jgi:outer membrane protein assembly factor BamB
MRIARVRLTTPEKRRSKFVHRIFILVSLVASATAAHAAPGDLLFKLAAPEPQLGARFGDTVASIDGNILVGEPLRPHPNSSATGRAYLFDGQTGVLKVTFENPQPTSFDAFATAIGGGDGQVFISTNGLTDRVYSYDATTGDLSQTVFDPDGSGNNFGLALAYGSSNLLVSSAYPNTVENLGAGRAYLFEAATGQLKRTVPNPEPNAGDGFGSGMSLSTFGEKIAVGGIGDNSFAGRVWIFDRESGNVLFQLDNPNPESAIFDWFGWSVAANEDMIVVGAREDGSSGVEGSGTTYIFDSDNGMLRHTLFSPLPQSNGEFGRSVAITSDGNVLVGAWGTSVDGIEGAGHVYSFDGQTGNLLLDIPNPEPTPFAQFGWSVAGLENRIIVSARGQDSVYVYADIPEPRSNCFVMTLLTLVFGAARWQR